MFVLGWRACREYNALFGGITALLLYVTHPLVFSGAIAISAWDAFFGVFFFLAWSAMEDGSLFMRSWILAGVYAFGLWVGSSFIFWIPLAMLPWMAFSRRPSHALGQLATVVIGGLVTSTLLTLVVVPVLYSWIEQKYGLRSDEQGSK